MATDYYELLGVPRGADEKTIKAAYRKLAMDCHPDRHGGCTDKEAHFKALNEAYDVLKDPQKRAAYDRFGHAAFQNGMNGQGPFGGAGGGFEGFSDIFSSIFGEFMDPRAQRASAARGSDLRYDLELTLEEAYGDIAFRTKRISEYRAIAHEHATGFAKRHLADAAGVTVHVRDGNPFVEILQAARDFHSDLIVMGTHGRTGMAHLLIGSVAEKVVRASHVPVVTVREAA